MAGAGGTQGATGRPGLPFGPDGLPVAGAGSQMGGAGPLGLLDGLKGPMDGAGGGLGGSHLSGGAAAASYLDTYLLWQGQADALLAKADSAGG